MYPAVIFKELKILELNDTVGVELRIITDELNRSRIKK